ASASDPVGITSIGAAARSPRRMTDPLPNCLSICVRATSSALSRSNPAAIRPPHSLVRELSAETLEPGADNFAVQGEVVDGVPTIHSLGEHSFEIAKRHAVLDPPEADLRLHRSLALGWIRISAPAFGGTASRPAGSSRERSSPGGCVVSVSFRF